MVEFFLQRLLEDPVSTTGSFRDALAKEITPTLERGAVMLGGHSRIAAGGPYPLRFKAIGTSHLDPVGSRLMASEYHGMIEICDIPGRSEILIHPANKYTELLGCVAPGISVVPTVRGFEIPGGQSGPAFQKLYRCLTQYILAKESAVLTVVDIAVPLPEAA